jgi:hypothetical protein
MILFIEPDIFRDLNVQTAKVARAVSDLIYASYSDESNQRK